ncbi:GNAT family N-acetyltransferase [Streptomyces sp. SCA3-4]|uniref:GNAT family N-acetyltransferase n=1 Tax=Streptomyces sichuanensis TaxID=2871810 RepID=UPI001CE2AF31|nr:GNAT family N-acetyltransferase [Streptomyces sichuanensis]
MTPSAGSARRRTSCAAGAAPASPGATSNACWSTAPAGSASTAPAAPLALTSAGWLSQEAGVVDLALQVANAHQRRGTGTALARHVAAHARSRGAHTLTVHTDDRTARGALGTEVAGAASPRPRHGAPPDRAHRNRPGRPCDGRPSSPCPADRPVPGTAARYPLPRPTGRLGAGQCRKGRSAAGREPAYDPALGPERHG